MSWRFPATALFLLCVHATVRADAKLAGIFTDHAVLQRDAPVPIWGTASDGEQVTVQFAEQNKTATADADGKWMLTLDPMPASAQPRELIVSGNRKCCDVLVGEVWLCSGQSNMYYPMAKEGAADVPSLRLNCDEQHPLCGGNWKICSPETAGGFSAVAYYFGCELQRELGVPVGLVLRSRGGTLVQQWTPDEEALRVPVTKKYHALATRERDRIGAYNKALQDYVARNPELPKLAPPPDLPAELMTARSFGHEGVLFESFIRPLVPYAIRGVIWYQGEANSKALDLAQNYDTMLEALITSWRQAWGQGDFPFGVVQLPNWKHGEHWPWTRQRQQRVSEKLPGVGLVVTIDAGDSDNLHPANKRPVGERLARWALGAVYQVPVLFRSPMLAGHRTIGATMELRFQHADGGLKAKGASLRGFEIAGADGAWTPAEAQINGDSVVLSSAAVKTPVAARYGWAPDPDGNLLNGADLPASPFCTQDK